MADTSPPINPKEWVIYLFVDDGTSKAAVSIQIFQNIKSDQGFDPGESASLILQAYQNVEVPQHWGFVYKNGTPIELCWGYELGGKLDKREVALTDIYLFKHLKVLLFPSIDVFDLEKTILGELNRMPEPRWTSNELHHHRLSKLREDIYTAIEKYAKPFGFTQDHLTQMETYTFWGVPEMATAAQCASVQELLESARFQNVKLMTEAEAIGAWRSYTVERSFGKQLFKVTPWIQAPHDVLIIDAGGLTAHGIRAACSGFAKDGEFVLKEAEGNARIGKALGMVPCVDERLYQHASIFIGQKYGDFKRWLSNVGMAELAFRYLLSARFDKHKTAFDGSNLEEDFDLPIRTTLLDLNGDIIVYRIWLTGNHLKIWFDDAWDRIRTEIVEVLLTSDTRHLIVDGGFFRNDYLRRKVELFAEERSIFLTQEVRSVYKNAHPPVCNGLGCIALKLRGQPVQVPQFLLGMHQDEEYDPDIHTDIPLDSDLLEESETEQGDLVKIAPHRWQLLVAQTDIYCRNGPPRNEWLPQQFLLTLDDSTIRKTIYYTTNLDMQNKEPILLKDGKLQSDLQEFKTIVVDLSREELLRYPRYDRPRKGLNPIDVRYNVWAWLKIVRFGPKMDHVKLTWDLAPPGWEPTASGNVRPKDNKEKTWRSDVLLSKKFLPFLQRNNGNVSSTQSPKPTRDEASNMDFLADGDEDEVDMDETGTYVEEPKKKRRKRRI